MEVDEYLEKVSQAVSDALKPNQEEKIETLRDHIAMSVLQGNLQYFSDHDVTDYREIAEDAYNLADEMLKARES